MSKPKWLRSVASHVSSVAQPPPGLLGAEWSAGMGAGAGPHGRAGPAFVEGVLASLALPGEAVVMAVDPVGGYLAVGTAVGTVHLFGAPAVHITLTLRPAVRVRHLAFKPGSPLLIVLDEKDNLSVFDLSRPDPVVSARYSDSNNSFLPARTATTGPPPHPETPQRIAAYSARNQVLAIDLSPVHDHLFLGMRDGSIDAYDLSRLKLSPYRIANLWWEEEEILRKSGVPDAPSRRHIPLVVQIETHPKNLNHLLIAYEGGVVLLDVKAHSVLRTYQMRILPGGSGGGVANANEVWLERSPAVTCIAWRPDGEVFVVGHEDGCFAFWSVRDDSKPLMVRTLDHIDVEKMQLEDGQAVTSLPHEPVFKLAWSGFPPKGWMQAASEWANSGKQQQGDIPDEPGIPSADQGQQAAEGADQGSVLTVLGGAMSDAHTGVTCLHFPSHAYAGAGGWGWGASGPNAVLTGKQRQALRDTIEPTKTTFYYTPSQVEDFLLVPRDSPYYSMAFDPAAIIFLLGPQKELPTLPPPAAQRGLKAFAFPPARPRLVANQDPVDRSSPHRLATPDVGLPLGLSFTGSGAVLGSRIYTVSKGVYKRLGGRVLESTGPKPAEPTTNTGGGSIPTPTASSSASPTQESIINPLNLRGGKAFPILIGNNLLEPEKVAPDLPLRVLFTWHLDGSVRVHDLSLGLLLHRPERPMVAINQWTGKAGTTFDPSSVRFALDMPFPYPLPHLTVSTRDIIFHPRLDTNMSMQRLRQSGTTPRLQITDVRFATESLELAVCLGSGHVLHYKFGQGQPGWADDSVMDDVLTEREMAELQSTRVVSGLRPHMGDELHHRHSIANSMRSSGHDSADLAALRSEADRSLLGLDETMSSAMDDLGLNTPTYDQGNPLDLPPRSPMERPPRNPNRPAVPARAANRPKPSHPQQPSTASTRLMREPPRPPPEPLPPGPAPELQPLDELAQKATDGFKPHVMVDLMRGECSAFALSDTGFLAVACGLALALVDLRGPELILHEGFGDEPELEAHHFGHAGHQYREERRAADVESRSLIQQTVFTTMRVASDTRYAMRLLALRQNGTMSIWTISSSLDQWVVTRASQPRKLDDAAHTSALITVDQRGTTLGLRARDLNEAMAQYEAGAVVDPNDAGSCGVAIYISSRRTYALGLASRADGSATDHKTCRDYASLRCGRAVNGPCARGGGAVGGASDCVWARACSGAAEQDKRVHLQPSAS